MTNHATDITPAVRTAMKRLMEVERTGVDVLAAVQAIAATPLSPDELATAWRDACAADRLVNQIRCGDRSHTDVGDYASLDEAVRQLQADASDAVDTVLAGPELVATRAAA